MKRTAMVICAALFAVSATACGESLSKDQCESLYSHLMVLKTRAVGANKLTDVMLEDHKTQQKKLRAYIHKDFIQYCVDDLPIEDWNCVMAAKTEAEMSKCDDVD